MIVDYFCIILALADLVVVVVLFNITENSAPFFFTAMKQKPKDKRGLLGV